VIEAQMFEQCQPKSRGNKK